jgi:hypothetical protein
VFLNTYDRATSTSYSRVTPPVAPFGLCYDTQTMMLSRFGYIMPEIVTIVEGGRKLRLDDNALV